MGTVLQFPRARARRGDGRSAATSARILVDPRLAIHPLQRSLEHLAGSDPAIRKPATALSRMLQKLLVQDVQQEAPMRLGKGALWS